MHRFSIGMHDYAVPLYSSRACQEPRDGKKAVLSTEVLGEGNGLEMGKKFVCDCVAFDPIDAGSSVNANVATTP